MSTKNEEVKTYLIDCQGYSEQDLGGYSTKDFINLIDRLEDCAKFLDVPVEYLMWY